MTNPHVKRGPAGAPSLRQRSAVVRAIVRQWRGLVGPAWRSAPTLIACSGGADSSALALALATTRAPLILAHVVHDLRPREVALADRDAAAALASKLAIPFVEAEVHVGPGNAEAEARRARYQALRRLALQRGAPFVVTAHHAEDQLESMLLALLRGAGPRGLRGAAPTRPLGRGVTLLRPMLGVTRAEARSVCELAGWAWREDETNADTQRARAALRHGPLAEIVRRHPHAARRAARSAALLRDASAVIQRRAAEVFGAELSWPRARLRGEPEAVIGEGLRAAALRLTGGARRDRLGARVVDPVARAARDDSTEPREFHWPGGLVARVTARTVSMERRGE